MPFYYELAIQRILSS